MNIIYGSITGQTKRLINKLDPELINEIIDVSDPNFDIELNKFQEDKNVIIVPSYEDCPFYDDMIDVVNEIGRDKFIGIIGSGNINFNHLYLITAKGLSEELDIPIIYNLEFSGTDFDIENINNILKGES